MGKFSTITLAAVVAALGMSTSASAVTYKNVHSFCVDLDCTDGQEPRAGLASDGQGNFYGTTTGGGLNHAGTIFRERFDGKSWKFTRLYDFCSKENCIDGNFPQGGVVIDTSGALWGLTSVGGAHDQGVIWKLEPHGARWLLKTMHTFCNRGDCIDGKDPLYVTLAYQGQASGALYDGTAPLYGTTSAGGAKGEGTVFQFTPNGAKGTFKTIFNFCRKSNCADGGEPALGVTVDGSGNLFGASPLGGIGAGIVYKLMPNGTHWSEKTLHSFCSDFDGTTCFDGVLPIAVPMIDAAGNIFGTASGGGTGGQEAGIVYKLAPHGSGYKLTTLYNFCSEAGCRDGKAIAAGMTMDASGNLFGVTNQGGASNAGVAYELSGPHLTTYTRLYTFKGSTGAAPLNGLILGPSGDLLGTLTAGGKNGGGTIFSITP